MKKLLSGGRFGSAFEALLRPPNLLDAPVVKLAEEKMAGGSR